MLMWLRRFVWWKCLFWIALGCGLGFAIATLRPEVGPPAGGLRVTPERFVTVLHTKDASADSISNIVLYPAHNQVRLVTFDFRDDGKAKSAYTFAGEPFLHSQELEDTLTWGERYKVVRPKEPRVVYATRLKEAADEAVAELQDQPDKQWDSVTGLLDFAKTAHPNAAYTEAWWTGDAWRFGMPIAVGGVVLGITGSVLTRRSAADIAAADLLRNAKSSAATASAAPAGPSADDLAKIAELDALLSAKLAINGDPDDTSVGGAFAGDGVNADAAANPAEVLKLTGGKLDVAPERAKEDKSYDGEFYPTVRRGQPKAFSLVELLVSIGVIGILLAILLPAIIGARRSSDSIACAANLRSIGQGMTIYLAQNQNTFPAAYLYIGHKIENGVQTPTGIDKGYIHWSSYLYGSGVVAKEAFTCPSMNRGGLPPTNTPPDNRDPGQNCPSETIVDEQAPRLAYTVNEVLCPRNKFVKPAFDGSRVYHFVRASEVANSSGTILGSEMVDNAYAISYYNNTAGFIMSHRPIHGFVSMTGELDMYLLPVGQKFRPATAADLDADPESARDDSRTRLDLVGRNHGKRQGYPDRRLTNFLYVDGHIETKTVYETVSPVFEWGEKFYSLSPNDDLVVP